jgi:hypothetical protein
VGPVRVLFDGVVDVEYGQLYVTSGTDLFGDIGAGFRRADERTVRTGRAGCMFLITGLHTGDVGFAVELHEVGPPVGDDWEEIVEASFTPAPAQVRLVQWTGEAWWPLDLPQAELRLRYCGRGLDRARQPDLAPPGRPPIDSYLLQFWPDMLRPDRVVRQTGTSAAYRHDWARGLPPPTPQEKAEAERQAALARQQAREQERRRAEEREWVGRLPSPRLRKTGGHTQALAKRDRDLVDGVAAADAALQA